MPPPVALVADSTADLDPAFRVEHGITTVPLRLIFGDEELIDGVDIDAAGFYARMRQSDRNPRTSQPTPTEFEAAFRAAGADGTPVLCTTMSSAMSGTYGAAMTAAQACTDLDVRVIDTLTVAIGHNAIVTALVEARTAGADAAGIERVARDIISRQRSVFTLQTLEYLRRGGRIGGAQALLGSVLNIKPVLQVLDGRIEPFDRVRTNQRAIDRIAEELLTATADSGRKARAVVAHSERGEEADRLADRVADACAAPPTRTVIGPIVGCHAGPGVVGMSFHLV